MKQGGAAELLLQRNYFLSFTVKHLWGLSFSLKRQEVFYSEGVRGHVPVKLLQIMFLLGCTDLISIILIQTEKLCRTDRNLQSALTFVQTLFSL